MERLQEALSRARERRAQVPQSTPQGQGLTQQRPAALSGAAASVEEAWQNLAPFIPNDRIMRQSRVLSFFAQKDAAPFDLLRTKIVQLARANNWRRIAVTSPSPRCGKSTLVANLAFSLARQSDLRTIVVEVDMRRPELARMLGIQNGHSFASALTGADPVESHMVGYGKNLAFATNVAPSAKSSELLQSAGARAVLEQLEATFEPDLVIFDTAPMQGSDDTVGFLNFVDAVLIVTAAEVTTISQIDAIETEVAAVTNVLGVVFNKCRIKASEDKHEYNYY